MTEHPHSATPSAARRVTLEIRSSCSRPCQRPDTNSMDVDTAPIRQSSNLLPTDASPSYCRDTVREDQPQNTTKKTSRARPSFSKTKGCCEFNSHKCSRCSPSYRVEKKYRNQSQLTPGLFDNLRSPSNSEDAVPRWIPACDPSTRDSQRQYSPLERFHLEDGVSCIVDLGSGQLNISQPRHYLALAMVDNLFP
ncbi:uncharacterized protein H6S33_006545 [Morchella sextelata]|uniref:uncharacterized protein n=1 Tax=Morchella sextelata TaxID=1174677 RepID=UPI001D053531|nr:uncharacterized protein H6S33_006545 [Morchella sextelata]KAH0604877.1 hypothetical protein H6S33_006545 [Morchella sextelata]